jgi:hypothetical protein
MILKSTCTMLTKTKPSKSPPTDLMMLGPVLWDGVIAWEGYPSVEADIFMWKNGQITKLSDSVEDDVSPRIWNGQVVWQSFDGDDFEIYLYDGMKTVKLTQNNYDDVSPDIHDGIMHLDGLRRWLGC